MAAEARTEAEGALNLPRYRAGPVEYWLAEAGTQFVNGFIGGLGGGALAGVGAGAAASSQGLWSGGTLVDQLLIPAYGATIAGIGHGFKQFIVWHHEHPFPNPWAQPTGSTLVPFESKTDQKP